MSGGIAAALIMNDLMFRGIFDGAVTSSSSSSFETTSGSKHSIVTGEGFALSGSGEPTAGTIAGITQTLNGATLFDVTGLASDAARFYAFGADGMGALELLFSGNDALHGTRFDDVLNGFSGHDYLFGGPGADTLSGGSGNDHIYGQSAMGGDDGADELHGGDGGDYLQGNSGADTIDGGNGSDRIMGGASNDSILGGAGNDSVNGNRGDDAIDGGSDNDSLRGGQGNDSISGGDGNDLLAGDLGSDVLTGGAGADIFLFSGQGSAISAGADRIVDYVDGTDHISVGFAPTIILTGTVKAGDEAASVAQQLFDGHSGSGEIAALMVGSDTYLFYSSDGGNNVDSAILVAGASAGSFTTTDFV
ncbi:calcium-binding protein [Rhizorhabdus argentea]|uniref:calcium-binding protein n=1 Tax=Rhizorhabdus argentea TaxID=1387174 RepID=UPI0030ECA277